MPGVKRKIRISAQLHQLAKDHRQPEYFAASQLADLWLVEQLTSSEMFWLAVEYRERFGEQRAVLPKLPLDVVQVPAECGALLEHQDGWGRKGVGRG